MTDYTQLYVTEHPTLKKLNDNRFLKLYNTF